MKKAASALQFISSTDRDTWIVCGMALRSEFGDAARDIWMDWSSEADSFKESDARAVWKSFKGTGISLASLFHEAKQCGWRDDNSFQPPTAEQIAVKKQAAEGRMAREGQARLKAAQTAARKAQWILDQCIPEEHAYLASKGWPEMKGLVWRPDDETNLLCIPMRINGQLSSLQMIDKTGSKKFLTDGITAKAEFILDAHGPDFWTEGFATGWSLKLCLQALKLPYRIHICFSANNLKRLAHSGLVVADNDASHVGENAAKETGLGYFMSDIEGEDFNDMHRRLGLFRASQGLRKWMSTIKVNPSTAGAGHTQRP